jgi:hypothetical protein
LVVKKVTARKESIQSDSIGVRKILRRCEMISDLQPIFVVAGIGVIAYALETVLNNIGQGDKVVFLKITSWSAGAYVALEIWWKVEAYVERMFGV